MLDAFRYQLYQFIAKGHPCGEGGFRGKLRIVRREDSVALNLPPNSVIDATTNSQFERFFK
jgi:hypothetical protein